MTTYSTSQFKSGLKVMLDHDPCSIIENQFVKPGKGQAFSRVKLRNLIKVDSVGVFCDTVTRKVVQLARNVQSHAMCQMAAVGQVHSQHRISRLQDEAGSELKVVMIQFVVITVEIRTKKKGKWEKESASSPGRMSNLPEGGAKFDGKTTYVDSTKKNGSYPHVKWKRLEGKPKGILGEDFPSLSKKKKNDVKAARGIRNLINRRRTKAGKKKAIQLKIAFDFTLFVFVNDVMVAVIVWQLVMIYPPPSQLERTRRRQEREKAKKDKKLPTPRFAYGKTDRRVWYEARVKSIREGRPWTERQAGAMKSYQEGKNGYP